MNELLTDGRPAIPETEVVTPIIPVFVSGLPGKMATLVAEALAGDEQFTLLPVARTSHMHRHDGNLVFNNQEVRLVDYCSPQDLPPGSIAADFTTGDSAAINAISYTRFSLPFVMGTTGGDREEIEKLVRESKISAVIAPNMAVSVIEVQDELNRLLDTSPNHFQGWHMIIRESHQAAKRDVSGTAIAFQTQLERLGAIMDGEIESIRDPEVQRQLGIQNLDGHAYHWITLTNPTGETKEFRTSIEGRQPYVEGTLMAISFLSRKISEGSRGEIFTMSDVIREAKEREGKEVV